MRRMARFGSIFLALCVLASVLVVPPSGAQEIRPEESVPDLGGVSDDDEILADQDLVEPVVQTVEQTSRAAVANGPAADVATAEAGKSRGWGDGGVAAAVAVDGEQGRQVGNSPVSIRMNPSDVVSNAEGNGRGNGVARVRVNVLDSDLGGQLSPFAAVASVGFEDAAGGEVVPEEPFELSLDLSDVALGDAGANVYERLTITRFENCELFAPSDAEVAALAAAAGIPVDEFKDDVSSPEVICESTAELDAEFDLATRQLTAIVDVPHIVEAQTARERALVQNGVRRQDLDAKAGRERSGRPDDVDALAARGNGNAKAFGSENRPEGVRGQSVVPATDRVSLAVSVFTLGLVAQTGGSGPTGAGYGVTSSANSSSGDFSALPAPTLTEAQVGLFTGSAETSYPIPVPPASAGPEPSVAFVYSSASVDGMTMGSNNQSGPLGVGWSLSAGGSIQRQLRACNDPAAPGDRCISSAPDDVYTLSLAGRASTLVRVDTGGANANPKEFRLQSDPFWRIRLWRDNGVTNPTHTNEWWSVETPDGTVFRLGTTDDSVDWLPVWYPSGGCSETYALCDTARQWNITTTTDAFGNETIYSYNQEENWYNARGISTAFKLPYIQSSNLETITYGANPSQNRPANARVVLNWEQRCGQSSSFGTCGTYPNAFHDTPSDLWCGPFTAPDEYPTVCTEQSPTFWSHLRLAGVLSQVAGGNGTSNQWVTVAHHDPDIAFTRDHSVPLADSELHQVVRSVSERPIETGGTSFARNGFDTLWGNTRDAQSGTGLIYNPDIGTDTVVSSMHSGDWIRFEDVWLGQDSSDRAATVTIRVSGANPGTFQVRHGSQTGPILATKTFTNANTTAHARDFETFTLNIPSNERVDGVRDIYVTAAAGSSNIGWVSFIQFGRPGNAANINVLPSVGAVSYNGGGSVDEFDFRDNRLNHPAGVSAMRFARIETVRNQLGGDTIFTYGQNQACNPNVAVPPGSWDNNQLDCFPQWDASPAGTANDGFVVFNKWTVQSIRTTDDFSNQPDVVVNYDYFDAGWGFADNPDSSFDTWNEFRGYNRVVADIAGSNGGKTETRFHQGLHAEPRVGGGTWSRTVERSDGHTISDVYALRGQVYETRQLTDANGEISRAWTSFTNTTTTPGNTNRLDPRFTAPSVQETRADADNTARTRTNTAYNSWGQPLSVVELGDQSSTGDERSTATRYYNPTTSTSLGAWRGTFPCVTETRSGTSTAAPTTNNTGGNNVVRWSHTYYDGATTLTCSRIVDEPAVTRTAVAHDSATSGGGWLRTLFGVDSSGRVTTVTDPNENVTTTTYEHLHGQVTQINNPRNWDSDIEYDAWQRPIRSMDVNGRTSETFYDQYSRVTAIREPQDRFESADTIRITYNQDTRPATVQTETRINNNDYTKQVSFYDGFGRVVQTRALAPEVNRNYATAVRYDNAGRMQRQSANYTILNDNITTFAYPNWDTVPSFTQITYDQAARPTTSELRKGVDAADVLFTTSTEYDGFRTRFRDQKNLWTDTTINGLGHTLEVKEQFNNLTTSYEYNVAGDLLEVTAPDGEITTITYDRAGRKLTSDDPDSGNWSYGYDANSNLISQTDPSGDVTAITYDNLNRPTQSTVNGGLRGRWFYDPAGNLGLMWDQRHFKPRDGNGADLGTVYQRQYFDSWGRTTRDDTLISEPDGHSANLFRFRTNYILRDDNQISTVHHPSGFANQTAYRVDYTYNPRTGQAEGLDEQATSGNLTIVSDVQWNNAGQVYRINFGEGDLDPVSRWHYDPNTLRLTWDMFGTNNWTSRHRYNSYWYDDNANISSIREWRNAQQYQCFTYDNLDRLRSAYTDEPTNSCDGIHTPIGGGNYDHTYNYNVGGNLTNKTGTGAGTHTGTYTYADSDHAHAVTATSNGSTFQYNDDGDMTVRNLAGQPAQTLDWNEDHRLAKITENGSVTAEFVYGLDDTRLRRKTDDNIYTFYHADGTEYTWDSNTNSGTFTYFHQIAGRTVGFTNSDTGITTWMHSDQVNSTSVTHDQTGARITQRYTPFGETRTDDNLGTDHTYTGQVHDDSTGLGFYNARYYDPVTARFISADTLVPNPYDGQDFNRYSYVRNNPVRYSDPTGHWCFDHLGGPCIDIEPASIVGTSDSGLRIANNQVSSGPSGCVVYCDAPQSDLPSLDDQAEAIIAGILDGEIDIVSFGICGEFEGVGGFPSVQGQGCVMVEDATGDIFGVVGGGGGLGVGVSAGGTGGIIITNSGGPGTWPDFNLSGCTDVSGGGGVGGGVAFCVGATNNRQLDGTWALEVFGGGVTGASANVTGQASVAVNLPDDTFVNITEAEAIAALRTALDD